jgi:transposase
MDLAKLHLHWGACKRGRRVHKSYSLARAYREDGKNRKEIVVKLGKLSDSEVEQWKFALQSVKKPTAMPTSLDKVVVQSNRSYLDVAVILETWNSWGLSRIFDSACPDKKRDIPLSSIAALLTINRCIDPETKSQIPTWTKKTALPLLLDTALQDFNPSRVFRELSAIESCKDQISQHLCERMVQTYPEAMKSLFYDLSSTTFTGNKCLLVSWGHCKEGYENHIVLALIVNTKGLPIYWEVLEGGTADVTTISWLLDRLKEKLSTVLLIPTMVFDRGMVSEENLSLLEGEKVKYITAMDKNQIEEIAKFDFLGFSKLTPEKAIKHLLNTDFIALDETTFCKEINLIGERRYVLIFNAQLCRDQRKAREEQILRFNQFVEEQNKELLEAKGHRDLVATKAKFADYLRKAKLQSFIKVELEEKYVPKRTKKMLRAIRSYQAVSHVDTDKQIESSRLDGFWLLVSNLSEKENDIFVQDTKSIVQPYRDKVVIESSFRDIKSFIEIAPVHVWNPEHVRAHYTICVLAYLMDRTLTLNLHERQGNASKEIIAHERLYKELDKCRLNQLKIADADLTAYTFTESTETQKDLLDRLQMSHLTTPAALHKLSLQGMAGSYV